MGGGRLAVSQLIAEVDDGGSLSIFSTLIVLEFCIIKFKDSLVAQRLKCLPPMRETRVRSLGREDPLEKEMVTHSSILTWRIPWILSSSIINLRKLRGLPWWLSGKKSTCQCRRREFDPWVGKIPWRRKWQPTPVSCLGNPMDRGAWQPTVQDHKSRTRPGN